MLKNLGCNPSDQQAQEFVTVRTPMDCSDLIDGDFAAHGEDRTLENLADLNRDRAW
jgi:hypothetical protein